MAHSLYLTPAQIQILQLARDNETADWLLGEGFAIAGLVEQGFITGSRSNGLRITDIGMSALHSMQTSQKPT